LTVLRKRACLHCTRQLGFWLRVLGHRFCGPRCQMAEYQLMQTQGVDRLRRAKIPLDRKQHAEVSFKHDTRTMVKRAG
jgi:hypothetical protein